MIAVVPSRGVAKSSKPISGNHPSIFVEKNGGGLALLRRPSDLAEVSSFFQKHQGFKTPKKGPKSSATSIRTGEVGGLFLGPGEPGSLETGFFPKNLNPGFFFFWGGGSW